MIVDIISQTDDALDKNSLALAITAGKYRGYI
jgi:hypothetical protein